VNFSTADAEASSRPKLPFTQLIEKRRVTRVEMIRANESLSTSSRKCRNVDGRRKLEILARGVQRRGAEKGDELHLGHDVDVNVKPPPQVAGDKFFAAIFERSKFLLPIENKTPSESAGQNSNWRFSCFWEQRKNGDPGMTYASTAKSSVGNRKTIVSKPASAFRPRKMAVRPTHCESSPSPARDAAELQAAAGRKAFEEMFVASRPKFVAMARTILRNREDAEDAVQNSFLSGYLHLRSFEGRSALSTWFTRIVLNAALMIRRKRKRTAMKSILENNERDDADWVENIAVSEPNPEMLHSDHEILQVVEQILGKMKPALRQAFRMSYFEELSGSEACAALGVPAETFKARLFRAKRQVFDQAKRSVAVSALAQNVVPMMGSKHK
jgi:RNA polymerase sigma-70 factor, ECF subfamily